MTDKQQPPVAPERIWLDAIDCLDDRASGVYYMGKPSIASIEYARVHSVDGADGEVEQLNERIAELERRLKISFGKLPCALCGGPHDFDTSIPSVIWNSVIRAKGLPDYLCTTCIVREFVRHGQGFTAQLWNEEFNGVPIELVVNGQNARDAAAIQEENNSLRNQLSSSEQPTGSGKCEHGISWSMECLSCGPSDFKAVATTSPTATAVNRSYADGYTRGFRHGMQSRRSISGSERRCGFCNKSEYEVSALIQAAVGYICNECVQICANMIVNSATGAGEGETPCEVPGCVVCAANGSTTAEVAAANEIVDLLKPGRSQRDKRVYAEAVAAVISHYARIETTLPANNETHERKSL